MTHAEAKQMELRVRLAAQLKFWMLRDHIDVKGLAANSELTEKQIYRWKNLEQSPTLDKVAVLADALNIPPAVLLMPLQVDNGADDREDAINVAILRGE